jgi:hypothetical protein
MNLSRRSFLRFGAASAVVAATNPVHFLAPIGGWHSDVIFNPNLYGLYLSTGNELDSIANVGRYCRATMYWQRLDGTFYTELESDSAFRARIIHAMNNRK